MFLLNQCRCLNFTAIIYLLHVLPFFVDQTYYRENIRLGKQSFI